MPYEPMEILADKGVEANDNENIKSGYMQFCEPQFIEKKQGVVSENTTPLQIGCSSCTVFELLKAHRSEVISIKEQIRYVKERLAA